MQLPSFAFLVSGIGTLGLVSMQATANVIVVGTGFGITAEAMASKDQNDSGPQYSPTFGPAYYSTSEVDGNCGVQKFKPNWGTLNGVELKGEEGLTWEVDIENNQGEGGYPPQGGGVSATFAGGSGLSGSYFKQPYVSSPTNGQSTQQLSDGGGDYVGYGVHDFALTITASATARGDQEQTTASGTFYGIVTVKYTFDPPANAILGDTDGDGSVTPDDVTAQQQLNPAQDWDNSGDVDYHDTDYLVHNILNSEYGDFNLDGQVTIADFNILASHFNHSGGYGQGDANGDGVVDEADYDILIANYGWHR